MPQGKRWTIRVKENEHDRVGLWCGEILRYAGISHRIPGVGDEYTLGEGSKAWAEMNADRIRSFGIAAVAQEVR